MSEFSDVIIFASIGSLLSLIGGVLMLTSNYFAGILQRWAAPFAAGALLAAAFGDLIPEIAESGIATELIGLPVLFGILLFFLVERFLRYFHHHHEHQDEKGSEINRYLVITGDSLHNFIDGIAIALAFSLDYTAGVATTSAVILHEIPQEVGDFGLLLRAGMKRSSVFFVNLFSALVTIVGAALAWQFADSFSPSLTGLLVGIAAGFFIYIALSDIIPTIHVKKGEKKAYLETLLVVLGALVVLTIASYLA